jgi:hypothetical protein
MQSARRWFAYAHANGKRVFPSRRWQRKEPTPTGTMRDVLDSAGQVAKSWLIDQTPEGGKLADTIGAILADLAAEEIGQ